MDDLTIIRRLGGKGLIPELAAALRATAREVVETGKPGTVTATFTVKTQTQGDPFITVSEKVARKSPARDAKGAWFYALGDDLHEVDPREVRMDFREIDPSTGEILDGRRDDRSVQREVAAE